jgi:hypothetical protein
VLADYLENFNDFVKNEILKNKKSKILNNMKNEY